MRKVLSSFLHALFRGGSRWWMVYDALVALFSIHLAYFYAPKAVGIGSILTDLMVVFPFFVVIAGNVAGLYDKDVLVKLWKLSFSIVAMALLSVLILSIYSNLILYEKIGRYVLAFLLFFVVFISGITRIVGYVLAKYFRIRVLVVGQEKTAIGIAQKICEANAHYLFLGFCDGLGQATRGALGGLNEISRICRIYNVDLIVLENLYTNYPYVLDKCFEPVQTGCNLVDESAFFEQAFNMVLVDKINPGWFYASNLSVHNNFQAGIKRCMDILISLIGLIFTILLLPFVWLSIRLSTKGPIFYSQIRCGRFGQLFKIYKFCTMRPDAESKGVMWAHKNDERVTVIGKFLRRTRLDELPQFWNVLKGDMSFVGPRPERPELVKEIEKHAPLFSFRHCVKPGITGFAQINYRYCASVEDALEKLKYDLYYIKNWSVLLDFRVILRTISAVMKGAR